MERHQLQQQQQQQQQRQQYQIDEKNTTTHSSCDLLSMNITFSQVSDRFHTLSPFLFKFGLDLTRLDLSESVSHFLQVGKTLVQ